MNAQPASTIRVAWIDPTGPLSEADQSRLNALGWDVRVVSDPSALITSLVHIHVMVLRVEHDTVLLEECLSLAQMPGRRLPVVCRVPPQHLEWAVEATRMGADQVVSTQEWAPAAWTRIMASVAARPAVEPPQRQVVFVDPASRQLLALAQKVAQTEVSALLIGPTGAGKEVMARVLHEASPRAQGPFVSLNCGALPEHLIEDLLFGHEKGAFSGAIRDHQGIFEQARGGTVFLDEIGEMPLHLQTRLLRVLQERCITRLGGSRTVPVDVRIVAATNKDLKQAMLQREFREDLYFRISTFTLRVLPLRERPQDILPLAAHVLQQHGTPGEPYRITDEARRRLLAYHWPGNVRELGNVIQRALVLCPGRVLTEEHLLFDDDIFGAPTSGSAGFGGLSGLGQAAERSTGPANGFGSPIGGAWPPLESSPAVCPAPAAESARLDPPAMADDEAVLADRPGSPAGAGNGSSSAQRLQWAVRHSELKVIQDAIRNTRSREAAARLLGISPRTLRYKLAQMRDMGLIPGDHGAHGPMGAAVSSIPMASTAEC